MSNPPKCAICHESAEGEQLSTLTQKGSDSINRASASRKDDIQTAPGDLVHQVCRRNYTNVQQISKCIKQQDKEHEAGGDSHVLRSAEKGFHYDRDCLFCRRSAQVGTKRKSSDDSVFPVRTVEFKDALLKICDERGDAWADIVKSRVLPVHDLHVADAVYHQGCSVNFRTKKHIPSDHQTSETGTKRSKMGRPLDKTKFRAFLDVANFLEDNDDEQITINDLIARMENILQGSAIQAYGYSHMKSKLKEYFGDKIIVGEINGKPNVVTFRSTATAILQEFYNHTKSDPESEKKRIIETAAKLIREEIKSMKSSNDIYPEYDSLKSEQDGNNFLPESLRILLKVLFVGKNIGVKTASIGQAIMQSTRPRVILAPLQIGLGVQLHHHFASRFLIDTLHRLGFCCSYQEVQRFVNNSVMSHGTDIPGFIGEFVQYAADNADHNLRTLDGNNTFHGMGMIAAVTPATKISKSIIRSKITPMDVSKVGRVPILFHREESRAVKYQKLVPIMAQNPTAELDLVWKTAILFASPRPAWSGMMQFVQRGNHPGKSSFVFLPMIDMSPSNVTCIYSTLKFLCEHARRHDALPIITFDQPLWWKALQIIAAEPEGSDLKSIVLRLGGFHTEMSFVGSIGHLMAGTGLQEVMELVYAPNAVVHMMTGKAIARAVRAHLLIDGVLNGLILSDVFDVPLPQHAEEPQDVTPLLPGNAEDVPPPQVSEDTDEYDARISFEDDIPTRDRMGNPDLDEVAVLYAQLMTGSVSAEEAGNAEVMVRIKKQLDRKTESLKSSSRTAALWLQYMEMIDILRKFLRAERTGNWAMHLEAISEMLPFMAASGHNLYTKSARIYLQRMSKLQVEHPDIYHKFVEGFHVVRRSDRLWAGLSVDLVIEQVLMRSMKTSGGLTRGRGMTEQQRSTWLLSMPACAEVNSAMQELTRVNHNTGEQNKDMTDARQARDSKDTLTIQNYLTERNPFSADSDLRNISTGVHGHPSVNVDNAKEIGNAILTRMEGHTTAEYTFKKRDQAITLGTKSSVKIDGEVVQVDPQLLFQRLTIVAKASEDLVSAFKYELCSHPPALFDTSLLLRQPHKPALADAIWALLPPDLPGITGPVQHVLDGGALVHRIPWTRGSTYKDICQMYTEYVTRKYGKAVVVFDGYEGTSTKDMTHVRRVGGRTGATVTMSEDMPVTMNKTEFMANNTNKQQFINMLSGHLQKRNCQTYHAPGDADLLIVQKAVESANTTNTVLIGDDTDLLILLIYHTTLKSHDLFFKPEPKRTTKNPRVWNIKAIKEHLGPSLCTHILFIHTISGCDTTSRLFGIGKGIPLKKFTNSSDFCEQAAVFNQPSASTTDIVSAGENALLCLYNGKLKEGLNSLRHKRFCEKVATSTCYVQPQTLPPTSAAAKYHSLRVYYQVQQWKGAVDDFLPQEWGWEEKDGRLVPIQTDLPPAPQELLRVIRCTCKTDCSSRCTCKKHDIKCSAACSNCKGSGCSNSSQATIDEDEDDEDSS